MCDLTTYIYIYVGGRLPVTWYEADYVACLETHIMDAKTPSPQ